MSAASALPTVLRARLEGVQCIEASAGTGKTWTLSGLLLRFVVERGVPIDRILAVTFTKAATAELRERVHGRLQAMQAALDAGASADPVCAALLADVAPETARKRTVAALRAFDDAPISTIHGFCQRALGERAFACGLPFDLALVPDPARALQELVQDEWRNRIAVPGDGPLDAAAHALFVDWLLGDPAAQPAQLAAWLRRWLDRGELRIDRGAAAGPLPAALGGLAAQRARLAAAWAAGRDEAVAALKGPALSRASYPLARVDGWAQVVDAGLAASIGLIALPEYLDRFGTPYIRARLRKGAELPALPLFDEVQALLDAVASCRAWCERHWLDLRLDLLQVAGARLAARLEAQGSQGYRDLLLNLRKALAGAGGAALAAALRERYPVALIDEFQDTDTVQYEIFLRIYGAPDGAGTALFLVGDPKQAIYAFRGADVHAYLRAAAAAEERLTLTQNQRSVAPLVHAVNTLFEAAPRPFVLEGIAFEPVQPAPRPHPALVEADGIDARPLRFQLAPEGTGKLLGRVEAEHWAADATAAEVARLLAQARAGGLQLGGQALRSADIAILVQSARQGARLRDALARRGVASALRVRESVFASETANGFERLLLALAEPQRAALLRAALAGPLLGRSGAELAALDADAASWERTAAAFFAYHEQWRRQGFLRMFRRLLADQAVSARLARYEDGARRLTDLLHLAELVHRQEAQAAGIEAVLAWFGSQREDPGGTEEQLLRLESDENLVQILTIHASKGLEFPVTFVPFLWHPGPDDAQAGLVFYHDALDDHRAVLDAGGSGAALAQAAREALAERLRLAYVALTRARNRCYVAWGWIKDAQYSALGWLLHGGADPDQLPQLESAEQVRERVAALLRQGEGHLMVAPAAAAADGAAPAPAAPPALAGARRLAAPPPPPWRLASFSALHERAGDWRAEQPDHDQAGEQAPEAEAPRAGPRGGVRAAFPRGAAAGTCLHDILEHVAFGAAPERWRGAIATALRAAGLDAHWAPELAAWLQEACATPLPGGAGAAPFALAELAPDLQCRELEFHLPWQDVDLAAIPALAARHGLRLAPLPAERAQGFLKGYIDLVAQHEGRCYLFDYKSNWLGSAPQDYAPPALARSMDENGYRLQALLYTVAVHRWLGRRPGYDYERDFGGVRYLYLRGLHPQAPAAGAAVPGVVAERPPRALVEALDALFAGRGGAR
jgi:exodeoxyribonuclease V beta subunit